MDEIKGAYEFITALEEKITLLQTKLEALEQEKKVVSLHEPMPYRAQELFLVLYDAHEPVSLEDISVQTGLTLDYIDKIICYMQEQHIPLHEEKRLGKRWFFLEPTFKELQARKNIVRIDEYISRRFIRESR